MFCLVLPRAVRMCGSRAALRNFLRWRSKRKTKQDDVRSLVAHHTVQPANTWWGGGAEETMLALSADGFPEKQISRPFWTLSEKTAKTHGEEEVGLRKIRSVLLAVAEVCTEYLGLLLSEEFTEILLTHYIRWSITRWEMMKRLCKCTVAVFLGNNLNPWMTNVVGSLRTAD